MEESDSIALTTESSEWLKLRKILSLTDTVRETPERMLLALVDKGSEKKHPVTALPTFSKFQTTQVKQSECAGECQETKKLLERKANKAEKEQPKPLSLPKAGDTKGKTKGGAKRASTADGEKPNAKPSKKKKSAPA